MAKFVPRQVLQACSDVQSDRIHTRQANRICENGSQRTGKDGLPESLGVGRRRRIDMTPSEASLYRKSQIRPEFHQASAAVLIDFVNQHSTCARRCVDQGLMLNEYNCFSQDVYWVSGERRG